MNIQIMLYRYMKASLLVASSLTLMTSCKRDLIPANQKATTSQSLELTGHATALTVLPGTVPSFPVQAVAVTTLSGKTQATRILLESGIVTDADGNLYVTDGSSSVIRKVSAKDGSVSVFAGDGTASFKNGPRLTAEFNSPTGLAFDGQGNLYVADQQNHRIRIITTDGMVSTYAGNGVKGFGDGADSLAKFNAPTGVAVDGAGTVYVADNGNNRIRRISKTRVVTQWAGSGNPTFADGAGTLASFNHPFGIAVTAAGVAYIADQNNNRIRKIVSGVVSTLAGNGLPDFGDGTGKIVSFRFPTGLSVDAIGNIYVADQGNNRIRKVTTGGLVTTLAGSDIAGNADGSDTLARFNLPIGLAIDQGGNIYVSDFGNNSVRKLVVQPAVRTLAGNGLTDYLEGTGTGAHINNPYSISLDAAGTLYFEDGGRRFRKCTPAGTTSFLAGGDPQGVNFPEETGTVTDAAKNLYIADGNPNRIAKVTPAGEVSTFATDPTSQNVYHWNSSLNLDAAGNMIFTNFQDGIIRKRDPSGTVSILDSLPIPSDSAHSFRSWIYASTTDAAGNLYVAAAHQSTIYKVTPQGKHSVFFAGQPPASAVAFEPRGLAVDAGGKVYVADVANNRIVIFSPAGQFLTQAGTGTAAFMDGPVTQAAFDKPTWITINRATGILYIADGGNNRLRMMGVQ
jgi:sugar lactone lactonase YvrE